MKMPKTFLTIALCFSTLPLFAQPGGMGVPSGPNLGGSMAKIFGENSSFSADMVLEAKGGSQPAMTMRGKTAALQGKTRFEMNMAEKGGPMPPEALAQMKAMGMDMSQMIIVTRPDKKLTYILLPNMQTCVENPLQDPDAAKAESDFKLETTELGKETVDGHPCIKNKMVVTDDKGKKHESTVWNATDMKNFPVKIETTEDGSLVTMLFQNVKLSKPEASQFEPPANYKKYNGIMEMVQQEMMKKMGSTPPTQ